MSLKSDKCYSCMILVIILLQKKFLPIVSYQVGGRTTNLPLLRVVAKQPRDTVCMARKKKRKNNSLSIVVTGPQEGMKLRGASSNVVGHNLPLLPGWKTARKWGGVAIPLPLQCLRPCRKHNCFQILVEFLRRFLNAKHGILTLNRVSSSDTEQYFSNQTA